MYSFESRVRYSEVGSDGRLTLAAALDYLQDCCTFQSEDLGVGLDYLKRERVAWVLSFWQLKIARYPKMGERMKISTWAYDFKGFFGYRNFTIEDGRDDFAVSANSVWVFMDMESMRPVRITEEVARAYEGGKEGPLPGEWTGRKITVRGEGEAKSPIQVARRDIDTNRHMNNGKYVQVAEEYLPEGFAVSGLRAEYKKAARHGDTLFPSVAVGDGTVAVALSDEAGSPYAVVEFSSGGNPPA